MTDAKKPELVVYAGPNGSGKSTISRMGKRPGLYINADDIRASLNCSDLRAAQIAQERRENALASLATFTFETVLSTERNLNLMRRAREAGYFVRGIYVFTSDPQINISRVAGRAANGGHDVPTDKVLARYEKSLALLPRFVALCDVCHVYDNTTDPYRVFKKRKEQSFMWPNEQWPEAKIRKLVGINHPTTLASASTTYLAASSVIHRSVTRR